MKCLNNSNKDFKLINKSIKCLLFLQNQSGIYYDVDFEQGDMYSGTSKNQQAAIPMSTYTMSSRAPYYRQ
jgi:hypothetical protein